MQIDDFKLEVFFDKHEFNTPHLLAQSDCQAMTVAELVAMEPGAEAKLHNTWLGYTEVAGSNELREQVSELYRGVSVKNVLMFCGAEEAIFAYMNTVLSPGDEVICLTPTYQSLIELPKAIGAKVIPWRLRNQQTTWTLDFEELTTLITKSTKLIVINTPNNPTGYTLKDVEIDQLVNVAASHNIKIFSDEVYRGLDLDGLIRPALAEVYENAVTLGVMSKAYGLAGLRIGWLVGSDVDLLAKVQKYKHYLSICNSATSEVLAGIALKHKTAILGRNLGIIQANLNLANEFFERHKDIFVNNPPQCGSVAFHQIKNEYLLEAVKTIANVTPGENIIDIYCSHLAEQAGVLLLPGSTYEVDEPYFRMGYGRLDFSDGLKVLDNYLQNLTHDE